MANFESLTQLTADERDRATQKYQIIEPYLNNEQILKVVAENKSIVLRIRQSYNLIYLFN